MTAWTLTGIAEPAVLAREAIAARPTNAPSLLMGTSCRFVNRARRPGVPRTLAFGRALLIEGPGRKVDVDDCLRYAATVHAVGNSFRQQKLFDGWSQREPQHLMPPIEQRALQCRVAMLVARGQHVERVIHQQAGGQWIFRRCARDLGLGWRPRDRHTRRRGKLYRHATLLGTMHRFRACDTSRTLLRNLIAGSGDDGGRNFRPTRSRIVLITSLRGGCGRQQHAATRR